MLKQEKTKLHSSYEQNLSLELTAYFSKTSKYNRVNGQQLYLVSLDLRSSHLLSLHFIIRLLRALFHLKHGKKILFINLTFQLTSRTRTMTHLRLLQHLQKTLQLTLLAAKQPSLQSQTGQDKNKFAS